MANKAKTNGNKATKATPTTPKVNTPAAVQCNKVIQPQHYAANNTLPTTPPPFYQRGTIFITLVQTINANIGKHYTLALAAWLQFATSHNITPPYAGWFWHAFTPSGKKHKTGAAYSINAQGIIVYNAGKTAAQVQAWPYSGAYRCVHPLAYNTQAPSSK